MQEFPINYLALIVATVVKMALGALWYSPVLFGKPWQALAGRSDAEIKAAMPKALVVDLIGSFIMAFVLVHAVHYAGAQGIIQGAAVGFFNWLGFVAMISLSATIYEHKPIKLWAINAGFILIALLIMGAILAAWT